MKWCCIFTTLLILQIQADPDSDEQTAQWAQDTISGGNGSPVILKPQRPKDQVDNMVNYFNGLLQGKNDGKSTNNAIDLTPSNGNIKEVGYSIPNGTTNGNMGESTSTTTQTTSGSTAETTTATPEVPCVTSDGRSGICVVYYLCDVNNKVITDGAGLIDLRIADSGCESYLETCCSKENQVSGSKSVVSDSQQPSNSVPSEAAECGWNNPDIAILQPLSKEAAENGLYANYGDFPWMVAIVKQSETTVWVPDNYIGGGSLLHPSVVVTAYHKIQDYTADKLKCRAGEWDTTIDQEQFPIQERNVRKIVHHEEYYKTSGYYDIALVLLQKPFTLADAPHMGTACIARLLPPADTTCFSMGWGQNIKTEMNVNILKKVKLGLVEANECQSLLRTNTRLTELFVLHKSLTCAAGEDGVDTCKGDGGSPLVCPIGQSNGKTRYAMVGMVVYGLACGRKDIPGVYVNIPLVSEWIDEKMTAEGYNNDSYTY